MFQPRLECLYGPTTPQEIDVEVNRFLDFRNDRLPVLHMMVGTVSRGDESVNP